MTGRLEDGWMDGERDPSLNGDGMHRCYVLMTIQ